MSSQDLQSLFKASQQDGLSHQSIDIMIHNLDAQTGLGCVGAQVDDLNTDDVTLLVVVLDQSSSMSGVQQDVIDSFNTMNRALADSRDADSILVSAWTFDSKPNLLFGYTPVSDVKDLTPQDYHPNGTTALYDAVMDAYTGIVAYGQDLRNNGIRTRAIVVTLSDGGDNSSTQTASTVRSLSQDLLRQEIYTLAFVGFGDDQQMRGIAKSMGMPSVMTAQHSASEIRRVLNVVSGSVIRASQGQIGSSGGGFFS